MKEIMSLLFETDAFKVCEENKPFWYTSGKIGPYFINTHFLYGSEKDANELLNFINEQLENESKVNIPKNVYEKVAKQYEENNIFKTVMNELVEYIKNEIDVNEVDYISGGERRDWYFSMMVAKLLKKPHITIFKDVTAVESDSNFEKNTLTSNLEGKKVLHVADLLNQASSYIRAWIPAVEQLGGKMLWSLVVVDRMQGGGEKLEAENVKSLSLLKIDKNLFDKALELGKITKEQCQMLYGFADDPDGSMREFLINHPDFIENALNADEKTAKRAKLCKDGNLYNL